MVIRACKKLAVLVLVSLIPAISPLADDNTGQYQVMGLGNASCNAYLSEDKEGAAYFTSWLAGYMTAYNHLSEDTYSILGKSKDILHIQSWLRDYCTVNGTESFESAVLNLLKNLKYFRQKQKP